MENEKIRLVKERVQICSMIEYLDSINNGSKEAVNNLQKYSLKVQVEDNELDLQLDHNSFDAVYNMLLQLRLINTVKRNQENDEI